MHTFMSACTDVAYIHTYMYILIHTYTYKNTHIHSHVNKDTSIHMCNYTRIWYTHIHTYMWCITCNTCILKKKHVHAHSWHTGMHCISLKKLFHDQKAQKQKNRDKFAHTNWPFPTHEHIQKCPLHCRKIRETKLCHFFRVVNWAF